MYPVTSQHFWSLFTDPTDRIGQDLTDTENTLFYASKDPAGKERVGVAQEDRRTTISTYHLLEGYVADMALYWYRVKPVEDARREIEVLIMTARAQCQRAVKLGCSLPSLHDAIGHLLDAERQARRGQHLLETSAHPNTPDLPPEPPPAQISERTNSERTEEGGQKLLSVQTSAPATGTGKPTSMESSAHKFLRTQKSAHACHQANAEKSAHASEPAPARTPAQEAALAAFIASGQASTWSTGRKGRAR